MGKAKPTTRKLPDADFAFGKSEKPELGASVVCTSWQEHNPRSMESIRKSAPRDFKSLNKKAVIQGAANAIMNSKFRLENDARITNHAASLWKKVGRGSSLPAENFTYGRANRPQTPIDGIISNEFGETASHALQTRYGYLKDNKK